MTAKSENSAAQELDRSLRQSRAAFEEARFGDSAKLARQAIEQARSASNSHAHAEATTTLGAALVQLGKYREGLEELNQAVNAFVELDRKDLSGTAHNYIAVAYEELGDLKRAFSHYDQALALANESSDRLLQGRVLANLGDAMANAGDYDQALTHLKNAARRLEPSPDQSLLGWVEGAIARAYVSQNQLDEAGPWFESAIKHAHSGRGSRSEGEILLSFGEYLLRLGHLEQAIENLRSALHKFSGIDARWGIANAHLKLSQACEQQGNFELALEHHREYHRVNALMIEEIANVKIRNLSAELELERARLEGEMSHLKNVELAAALDKLERQKEVLERLSVRDPLTGIFNRRYLDQALIREFKYARRHDSTVSIAMLDADHFKQVNDRYSHATGDQVLRLICEVIASHIRSEDILARFGGEEFVLLFPGTQLEGAVQACEKIRQSIEEYPWQQVGEGLTVTLSFGVADSRGSADYEEVMSTADRRLYMAKDQGRNRVNPAPNSASDQ